MGSDIALDLKLCAMKTVNDFIAGGRNGGDHFSHLVECIHNLEEEKNKIEAFKRELPISALLISHVIGVLRGKMEQCRSVKTLKGKLEEQGGVISEKDNKMSWMSSAQLWSDHNCTADSTNTKSTEKDEIARSVDSKLPKASDGGFVLFKGINVKKTEKPAAVTDLSLVPPTTMKNSSGVIPDVHEDNRMSVKNSRAAAAAASAHVSSQSQHRQQQMSRKERRSWSPELHRRFVLALQQLGGAQVATPKQIRDLMKVDGLTNDEVKSHLQKYRLHTRRMPNSTTTTTSNKPVAWLGGLWHPEGRQCTTTSQQSRSHLGSPQGPLQLTTASAGAVSLTAGDSCEEDGKSESYSWK